MLAVVGGFQDRIADLRSFAGQCPELINPAPTPLSCVLVQYVADPGGNVVPVTLNANGDTPTDPDELAAWAAAELDISVESIVTAVYGTDALRVSTLDTAQYLAQSLGAELYPGLPGESAASISHRRALALTYYFPRLRIKGTSESFTIFAKLAGFDSGAIIPLWTRLSPRFPQDVGLEANGSDFAGVADILPSGQLPDPAGVYVPTDFTDGPFFSWASGSLSDDPDSPQFYPNVINGRNPFFSVTQLGVVAHPAAGAYVLSEGAPGRYAETMLSDGTVNSNLLARGLAEGSAFNGLRIVVVGSGGHRDIAVTGQLSSVKYRSSYFDAALFKADAGTVAVTGNEDLAADPALCVDGTATAPFRPWAGGAAAAVEVSLWPERAVTIVGTASPRQQAAGTLSESDYAGLLSDAQRTFDMADEVQAATRLPRRRAAGYLLSDQIRVAAYPCVVTLANMASAGSFGGSVAGEDAPGGSYDAEFFLNGTTLATQSWVPGAFTFAAPGLSGSYSASGSWWQATVSDMAGTGTLTAAWSDPDPETVRREPSDALKIAGAVCYTEMPEGTMSTADTGLQMWDDVPWLRPLRGAGENVDSDLFTPVNGDPEPNRQTVWESFPRSAAGVAQKVTVYDFQDVVAPPFFKLASTDKVTPLTVSAAGSGTLLYPVVAVSPTAIVAEATWKPGRSDALELWWPLTEHPYQPLLPTPAFGLTPDTAVFDHTGRTFDNDRGWTLAVSPEGTLSGPLGESLADYAFAFTARPASSAVASPTTVSVGSASVHFSSGTVSLFSEVSHPLLSGSLALIFVNVEDGVASLVTGNSSGWSAPVYSPVPNNLATGARVIGGDNAVALQDFSVWNRPKTAAELDVILRPLYTPLATPVQRPYVGSTSSDRWALEILASGFVVPEGTLADDETYPVGAVVRYTGAGVFDGNPAYKQVGLGGAQSGPVTFSLGTTGIEVPATGKYVAIGSIGEPGYNVSWEGSGTTVHVDPPYSSTGGTTGTSVLLSTTWPPNLSQYNAAVDRIYLPGDDGLVYQVGLDDVGAGPVFTASLPLDASRPLVSTDFQTRLGIVATSALSDDETNELGQYLLKPGEIVPIYTATNVPPAAVYLQSRAKCWVDNAFSTWVNRSAYGESLGAAALDEAGVLEFENSDTLPAGNYRLSVDAGNAGTVDNRFAGFDVTVSLVTGVGEPVTFDTVLLPGATGTDPRGWTFVEFKLPYDATGGWRLQLDWTNDRDVPSRGEYRRLVVYAYTLRRIASELQWVIPLPISIVAADVSAPPFGPGAYVAAYNSYGTIVSYTHEQDIYSDTLGFDTFNNANVPLADQLTGSTLRRRDYMRAASTYVPADATPPAAPTAGAISVAPVQPWFNLGETINLTNVGATADTQLRRVWQLWENGTIAQYADSLSVVATVGGTHNMGLEVVDDSGQSASVYTTVIVNEPPQVLAAVGNPAVAAVPYDTTLSAIVIDRDNDIFDVSWYSLKTTPPTFIGNGTEIVGYTVTQEETARVYAVDNRGGTNWADVPLGVIGDTSAPTATIVTLNPNPLRSTAKAQVFKAAAVARDPAGLPFTTLWEFWDGVEVAGQREEMPYFNGGTYCTVERTLEGSVLPLGTKIVAFRAENSAGAEAVARGKVGVVSVVNPIIVSVTASALAVKEGTPVVYTAVAYDATGADLSYNWAFPAIGAAAYGASVQVFTSGLAGRSIGGAVVVTNDFGGEATAPAPDVYVRALGLSPITIDPAGGVFSQGVLVEIASPDSGVLIRYALNGPTPETALEGVEYTGKVMIPYVSGATVQVTARAFKDDYAPSLAATAIVQFVTAEAEVVTPETPPVTPPIAQAFYNLTVRSDGPAFDTTTGSGAYAAGAVISVHADLDVGEYRFVGWSGTPQDMALLEDQVGTTTLFTMPARNATLTADYDRFSSVLGTTVNIRKFDGISNKDAG